MSKLRYSGELTRDGATVLPRVDDPNSADFVPLAERSPIAQARFWALRKKGDGRVASAEGGR